MHPALTNAHIFKSIWEIQESQRCSGIKCFKTFKWPPKIEGVTEQFKNYSRRGSFSWPDQFMQAKKGPTE